MRFGEFELDEANALLIRDGSAIDLAPTPFKLLCVLARRPGSLLTKHALLDEVWGHRFVSDSVLKGAISDIRSALGDDPRQPRFIQTVPRRGYRFVAIPAAMPARIPLETAGLNADQQLSPSFVGRAAELARLRPPLPPCCARLRRPGCCNCRGSAPRNSARPCSGSWSVSHRNECSAKWASSWIAIPNFDRCC